MRFGVHAGQQDRTLDQFRTLWRNLDQWGMDWISIWDHFYEAPPRDSRSPHFEAIATLAALATETERVRVACLVFCVPYRNPALLAKALTTIDHLSHGRLEVGLGAGWHEPEFRAYGYGFPPIGQRISMFQEGLRIVRGMLSQERTTFDGKFYHVTDATCEPRPLQPHVPIWVGGTGEQRTLRTVARFADGWNAAYTTPEEFARLSAVLNDWCAKEGRDPATVRRSINLSFSLTTDRARAASAERDLRERWGEPSAARLLGGALLGTPDDAADRIVRYIEAGAQDVNVALRWPWEEEALRVYVQEVVPAMRRRFAGAEA